MKVALMAEEAPIGNDEPRRDVLLPTPVMSLTSGLEQEQMAHFHRSITRFAAFPRLGALCWLPVFAALAATAAPAEAAPRGGKALRAYNGTWNVVFATTRGNCSSGYSVPFTVI